MSVRDCFAHQRIPDAETAMTSGDCQRPEHQRAHATGAYMPKSDRADEQTIDARSQSQPACRRTSHAQTLARLAEARRPKGFVKQYFTRNNIDGLLRDDANFANVAAWEYTGEGQKPLRHTEPLEFESVHLATRSYK